MDFTQQAQEILGNKATGVIRHFPVGSIGHKAITIILNLAGKKETGKKEWTKAIEICEIAKKEVWEADASEKYCSALSAAVYIAEAAIEYEVMLERAAKMAKWANS